MKYIMMMMFAICVIACSDENPSGVGNFCESDSDCTTGTCYQGNGGGYCTTPCQDEGNTEQCPQDLFANPSKVVLDVVC